MLDTPCDLWEGSLNNAGYGQLRVGPSVWTAHRLMWANEHGEIPPGAVVMHLCDVRSCIRLEHLRLGTYSENARDMMAKGRENFTPRAEFCQRGHNDWQIRRQDGKRYCRTCRNQTSAAWKRRNRRAAGSLP